MENKLTKTIGLAFHDFSLSKQQTPKLITINDQKDLHGQWAAVVTEGRTDQLIRSMSLEIFIDRI